MDMSVIRKLCGEGSLRWTNHIMTRIFQRGISIEDVESSLQSGEIIEEYPADYPYPSCLVLGFTQNSIPLHVVCGVTENELWMITAYNPRMEEWEEGCRNRRRDIQ